MTNQISLGKDFFFGGNSTFTVESEKTGQWRTFKIRKMKANSRFPNPAWAVALLAGPDNENDFQYIGKVNPDTGMLKLGSRFNDGSLPVVIFRWLMGHVFTDMVLPNGKVHHEGKCGCCGRKLTVPESIQRGIGPECWSRLAV